MRNRKIKTISLLKIRNYLAEICKVREPQIKITLPCKKNMCLFLVSIQNSIIRVSMVIGELFCSLSQHCM